MSKVLHLTLKKKWFDMIASGEKKEEYREDKQFWRNRLLLRGETGDARLYHFVKFRNGYGKNAPTLLVECKGITAGKARPEWSDNWPGTVFIIKLGNIVSPTNPA